MDGEKTHVLCNGERTGRSTSSKVIDFGTNWKRVCNFLLVISSNLDPILPRFTDIAGFLLRTATQILEVFPWTRGRVRAEPSLQLGPARTQQKTSAKLLQIH